MQKMKHISIVVMILGVLSLLLAGCGGGGGGGGTETANNSANNPSSNPTSTTTSNTTTTTTSGTLKVKVENWYNAKVPNATVVLGDSNGVMITYKPTDSNGEATFDNPPANATVTAANSCVYPGSTNTNYGLDIEYDINALTVTLSVNDCNANSTPSMVNVKVTDIPAGASSISIQPHGYSSSIIGGNASATISINADDIQSDGKISLTATAMDSSNHPLSYGVLTDLTLVSGMTVTIAANQTLSTVQYQINNIPSTAKNINPYMWEMRKNTSGSSAIGWQNLVSSGTSTTIRVSYIPAFGDMFGYNVSLNLDQNSNGTNDAYQSIYKWGATTPADQAFDFSQMPVIPSNLAVAGGTTATPTISWSGNDTSAIWLSQSMYFTTSATTTNNPMSVGSLGIPTRNSVTFPQLPDSLSVFRPTEILGFSVGYYQSDMFTSYADYLSKIEQYNNGTWTPPTNSTSKTSSASYSSTQTLAPLMNKDAKSSANRVRRF